MNLPTSFGSRETKFVAFLIFLKSIPLVKYSRELISAKVLKRTGERKEKYIHMYKQKRILLYTRYLKGDFVMQRIRGELAGH